MNAKILEVADMKIRYYEYNTVVVGSGASGFNAADRLATYGVNNIAIVTEGINMGTSRNTGSDKQTYYKYSLCGSREDSIYQLGKNLFDGGSMDGDIALVEAALSAQCFYKLVEIGVPFPHNRYGEYVGYKTDHDSMQRATSVGPLTSKYMTEKLQIQIESKQIELFNGFQIIGIITDENKKKSLGLLTLDVNNINKKELRYIMFLSTNIIYAVGGPAGIYKNSVYPESQNGASGIAFEASVAGKNLTEWQYGIASIKFRWNLSGAFQQVLPRYISTNQSGEDEKEFLLDYFEGQSHILNAIFLKGYQWPFDSRKIKNFGSSLIDLAVYNEIVNKKRRVFVDYINNPFKVKEIDYKLLNNEAYEYLKKSNVLFGSPIERLVHINQPAVDLYKNNGIDLHDDYLEIAVCAQHNNGGLKGDLWWESNLKHFFVVGEVNGTHGVYRPGGSALNSGQVGSTRAAQYIFHNYNKKIESSDELLNEVREYLKEKIIFGEKLIEKINPKTNIYEFINKLREKMSDVGSIIREKNKIRKAIKQISELMDTLNEDIKLSSVYELPDAFKLVDIVISQFVYLSAMENYIDKNGISRGSYLVCKDKASSLTDLIQNINVLEDKDDLYEEIQEIIYDDKKCTVNWRKRNPMPKEDCWFENIWNDYMKDKIIK